MTLNSQKCRGFLLPIVLVSAAAAALAVDVPIAQTFRSWNDSPMVCSYLSLFNLFEIFGHGLGVIVLLLAIHQLDADRRWAIPRMLTCALAAGLLADLVKMFISRDRPRACDFEGAAWSTFGPCFASLGVGSSGQSFPSAHTATAVGFAAGLIWLYPQGRLLFSALAALVACQRMVCGAHYLSDVLIGAAIGCLTAQFVLKVGRLPANFDRWEERWRLKRRTS